MIGVRSVMRLAIALVVAGLVFASASFLVPGLALALLAGLALAWVAAAAATTRLERLPGPGRVVEGEAYPLRVRIDRRGLPLPPATLVDDLLPEPVAVGARGPAMVSMALRFPRRGRHSLSPPRLRLSDPVRLCERELRGRTTHGELLVLPRTEEVRRSDPAAGGRDAGILDGLDHGAGAALEAAAIDLEIDGLRPYRQGSPASRIHWRTVARTGHMYERRLVAGADAAPLIVLDPHEPQSEAALDQAVRAAASLCMHLAARGGCAVLLSDAVAPTLVDPRLRAWPDVHARLALVEAGQPTPMPRGMSGRAGAIWVSGATAPRAARPATRLSPGCFVVTPAPALGVPVAFTVAECSAQRSALAARGGSMTRRAAA